MKYLPLLWAGLWRKPVRTVLTLLAMLAAFVLFGLLQGVSATFDAVVANSHLDRLYVLNRLGGTRSTLPISYLPQIEQVPGVRQVTTLIGLYGAYYQDPKERISTNAIRPEQFFAVFPELHVAKDQLDAMVKTRTGALIGDKLAAKYGWKVGDRVPLRAALSRRDGSQDWTFDIVGIFTEPGEGTIITFTDALLLNYDYLDEERVPAHGITGAYLLSIADPGKAADIAARIDALFANSSDETETSSEKDFAADALSQIGNIRLVVNAIMVAVFFTLLFLTGNTMAQSVRERTAELAVLKTLGYRDGTVLSLVLAESLALCVSAALVALIGVWAIFPQIEIVNGIGRPIDPAVLGWGLAAALLLALVTGLPPAWRAGRMPIVAALRD